MPLQDDLEAWMLKNMLNIADLPPVRGSYTHWLP